MELNTFTNLKHQCNLSIKHNHAITRYNTIMQKTSMELNTTMQFITVIKLCDKYSY